MHQKELPTIDFRYLFPPLDAFNITHKSEYIKHGEKKKIVRKIFHFVNYDEFENEKIKELMHSIQEEKIVLPLNWLESDTLKYVFTGKFKVSNSVKQLKKHLDWMHNEKIQKLSEEALDLLKRGVIYAHGRDKVYRPVIVFDVHKINFKKDKPEAIICAFSHLLTTVYENMFLPGHIENWIIIIDINNMSIMNVPFKVLGEVISCMSNNYVSTVERLFIVNPSSSLHYMWKIIEAMMDPETVQKIRFLKKANFGEIQEFANENQIEEKYGGKHPNLTEFWPPKSLIDVRSDIPLIEAKKNALKERLATGCQLINCLPPKAIEDVSKKHLLEVFKKEAESPKIASKYEPKLHSPELSALKMDSPPLDFSNKRGSGQPEENQSILSKPNKPEESQSLLSKPDISNDNQNINESNQTQALPEPNSSISTKNEVFETVNLENNHVKPLNYNKINGYEIISERNEIEEKEQDDQELEKETVSQGKTVHFAEPILEREEKQVRNCQPCKECRIF